MMERIKNTVIWKEDMVYSKQVVPTKQITILANDPSICAWGYSVLNQDGKILETGCIKTESGGKKLRVRKGDDTIRRIREINERLLSQVKKHNIEYIVSELPHGSQSASAAVMIGICMGILETISNALEIGIEWYSENDSKRHSLNKSTGEKLEMVQKMKIIYPNWKPTGTKYIDEAVADSLSIHHLAMKESPALKLFKMK